MAPPRRYPSVVPRCEGERWSDNRWIMGYGEDGPILYPVVLGCGGPFDLDRRAGSISCHGQPWIRGL